MFPKLIPVLFFSLALSPSVVRGLPNPHIRDLRSSVSSFSTSRRSSILLELKNTGKGNNAANNNNGDDATSLCLDPELINTGSQNDGLKGAEPNTTASATSSNNFINICKGQTLTNGAQIPGGSCNGIPMGMVCSKDNMPSVRIQSPKNLDTIDANKDFTFTLQATNMQLGSFSNATGTYFAAPRSLNQKGQYIGHTHCAIQKTQSLSSTEALDPTAPAFFKGINEPQNPDGTVSIPVTGGLPPGTYRACTITTGSNHQSLDGPVAQRGQFDDCTIFTVKDGGGQANKSTGTTTDVNNKNKNTTTSGNNNKKDDKETGDGSVCDDGDQGPQNTGNHTSTLDGTKQGTKDKGQKTKSEHNDHAKDHGQKNNSTTKSGVQDKTNGTSCDT